MNILAHCITWNRPELLGRSIHCFLQQTDPNVSLIVLDDAGQYQSQEHERWSLVSTSTRYPTMGQKRNAAVQLGLERYPRSEAVMLWDDDDCCFSHAAEYISKALEEKVWAQPRLALEMTKDQQGLKRVETIGGKRGPYEIAYGGCWAWRLDVFNTLGRFTDTDHSEDLKIAWPCLKRFGESADSSPNDNPWYYYNRLNNSISGEGKDFYAMRGRQTITRVEKIPIGWNGTDIFALPIEPNIQPRPW